MLELCTEEKNMKLAHIINVTEIDDSKKASYLDIAQPLTMRSMVIAREAAKDVIDVDLIVVKHKAEKLNVPPEFIWAPDLDKYAWEHIEALRNVTPHKPLPRLKDIILSLDKISNAEYFIFTNLDIGLYPHFYLRAKEIIDKGHDAFCINRRDLPKEHDGIVLDESKIELIYSIEGIPHPGIDTFVFKKEIVPLLTLGNVYIGYPPVGQVLKTQIEVSSKSFLWVKDEMLTFHLGSDMAWGMKSGEAYLQENRNQAEGLYVNCLYTSPYKIYKHKVKSFISQSFQRLICSPFTTRANKFLGFRYQRHNQRRQEHLATLGINLFNKSVFEAGAGIGDHTSFFLDRGCKVVCSEARDNNLKILRYRFPDVTVIKQNLEKPFENDPKDKFEVVYCYGLLYHLKTPAETLAYLADKCTGILLLETCVSFGNDEEINLVVEDKKSKTQSMSGIGCRPTRIWIFNQLKKHFPYVYMPKTQPNHQEFPLDWSEGPLNNQLTRSVFIASRQKISNPLLVEGVPMKQERSS